jgi:aminopeptidase-like protein
MVDEIQTEEEYEHDLVALLYLLNRVDMKQFLVDFEVNDKKNFNKMKELINLASLKSKKP